MPSVAFAQTGNGYINDHNEQMRPAVPDKTLASLRVAMTGATGQINGTTRHVCRSLALRLHLLAFRRLREGPKASCIPPPLKKLQFALVPRHSMLLERDLINVLLLGRTAFS